MNGQVHHRHGAADDDGVLAAGGNRIEASDIPIEDLVGRGLVRQTRASQNQDSKSRSYELCKKSRAMWHDTSSLRGRLAVRWATSFNELLFWGPALPANSDPSLVYLVRIIHLYAG